ncbi:MAG TPA: hypothetical protein VJA21_05600 [Verrucomicrobiae bacterium]
MNEPQFPPEPNEPPDAHQAFLLFTRTRSIRAVARALSLGRDKVAGWSQKYRWRGRLAAVQAAVTALPAEPPIDLEGATAEEWAARRTQLRQREWDLHCELTLAARAALDRWRTSGGLIKLPEILRLLELASHIGRLATGLGTERAEICGPDGGAVRVELEAALKKVYGEPATSEVAVAVAPTGGSQPQILEVEAVPTPGSQPSTTCPPKCF